MPGGKNPKEICWKEKFSSVYSPKLEATGIATAGLTVVGLHFDRHKDPLQVQDGKVCGSALV